ncbi:DUF502 domain-containing protein [bacterium]|nr:DUF502 domain-containing protein [bacterium]
MNVKTKMRHFFLAGILVLLPVFLTFFLFTFFFNGIGRFFQKYLTPLINVLGFHELPLYFFSALGILIIIIFITITGMIATNYIGRKIVAAGEKILARIPIVSNVYLAAKQFLEAFAFTEKEAFRHMVLVEYPRKGLYSIGFVTAQTQPLFGQYLNQECFNIFIPTTPNPTSGMLIIVPKNEVIPLEIPVEDGLKFVVSGGIIYQNSLIQNSANHQKEQKNPDNTQ